MLQKTVASQTLVHPDDEDIAEDLQITPTNQLTSESNPLLSTPMIILNKVVLRLKTLIGTSFHNNIQNKTHIVQRRRRREVSVDLRWGVT